MPFLCARVFYKPQICNSTLKVYFGLYLNWILMRWGGAHVGGGGSVCCIVVNKMSAFCVEKDYEGNISRRGDWNSISVWTRLFFYFMSTLLISWQLKSWSRFIMNESKHCAVPLVTLSVCIIWLFLFQYVLSARSCFLCYLFNSEVGWREQAAGQSVPKTLNWTRAPNWH